VYWQVVMLGVAVAVAMAILGLAVFMPPAPPAPPQLYVEVKPDGDSYLLYVKDGGKALREVWYSRNRGPLLRADGPIKAVCGDRIEVMAVYEDGSRHSAAAVVKCTTPLLVPGRSELTPDVVTYSLLSSASGEAVNGLMGNLPYKVIVTNMRCDDKSVTFDVVVQPLPFGSVLDISAYDAKSTKCYGIYGCVSIGGFSFTVGPSGFRVTAPSSGFAWCGPSGCVITTADTTFNVRINYTAPSSSSLASDYQGEAKTAVTDVLIKAVGTPSEISYSFWWNGQRIGYCRYTVQKVTETVSEAIKKQYKHVRKPLAQWVKENQTGYTVTGQLFGGYDIFLTNINGQNVEWSGVAWVDVWYDDNGRPVNVGLHIWYMPNQEIYQKSQRGQPVVSLNVGISGASITVYRYEGSKVLGPQISISYSGLYVKSCGFGGCKIYEYFDPTYIAGYKTYNVTRLVSFTATKTGSATGVGFGLQIPDLYFMTTFDSYDAKVNKTTAVTAYVNGQQATTYEAIYR